ncbi:MAG: hypothetical protein AB7E37_03490 [Candidatus Altimarinota bacterium]
MKKFFLQFLDKYISKNDFYLKNYDFSFLDFSNEENSKDIFYLEKIEVVNFFECENTIILDNSTGNNSYDELLSIGIFGFEKFVYLKDYKKNYEVIQYKILKNNYITKYNQVCKDEADILKVLSKYNKEKLYQVMDYIHNHSKKNTRNEVQNNGEGILNFLYNIGFTHISQKQANQIFTHIDNDILRYGLYFPIFDLFLYFYLFGYKTNNKSFKNFIYFDIKQTINLLRISFIFLINYLHEIKICP